MLRTVSQKFDALLVSPRLPILLSLLALVLGLPSLWGGLQFDDYLLEQSVLNAPDVESAIHDAFIFMDGNPANAQAKMDVGIYPWFSLPDGKVAFWRPLGALTHWLDFHLWPNLPALMHAQNIFWFSLGVLLVSLLYRDLLPAPAAGLAALLFAVDDAHGYGVGWISNRNALMAFAFGALSLLLFVRFDRTRRFKFLLGSVIFFALSILSAETGIAVIGYLAAFVFFVGVSSPRKWLTLLPYLLVIATWTYFYRLQDFGGWGAAYVDPLREPMAFLHSVSERAPVLWLGLLAYPPAELHPFVVDPLLNFAWIGVGSILAVCFLFLTFPVVRRDRNLQFLLAGAGLATLPVCSSLPANRLLFFIGLGAMAVMASWLLALGQPGVLKKGVWFVHLGLAALLLPWMSYSPKLFGNIETPILDAPIRPTVVIVSAPSAFHADYFGLIRRRYGVESPERVWNLAAGLSSVEIVRQNANTLIVTARDGLISGFDAVFRGEAHPMFEGETVSLNGLQVTVRALTRDGRPSAVEFRFDAPLESPDIQWLVWTPAGLVEWRVPRVGESVVAP